jgi:hypothetical protein
MKVTLIQTLEDMTALKARWQSLLNQSSQNYVFMTWEWAFTWWKHFGQQRDLFILVVEDRGEIIGILPLMLFVRRLRHGVKRRYLHFIGFRFEQRWNDWMDVIAVQKREVLQAALTYLEAYQDLWDFLDLWDIPEESDTAEALSDLSALYGFALRKKTVHVCPYVSTVSSWDSYYRASSFKTITGDIKRKTRRLQAKGHLEVEWAANTNLVSNLESLFDLHQRRQAARNQASMFSQEVYRNFYQDLVRVFPRDQIDCSIVKLDGKVIAVHFGFRYNHKFYWCTPSFDLEYGAFSPGKILLRYIMEKCFTDSSIHEFDFLAGPEPYKYDWATGERRSCAISITNAYMSGWTGKIFRRAPPFIRRSVVGGLRMFGFPQQRIAKQE